MTALVPLAKQEFPDAFANTLTTALGTVAALTWADAIKTLFAERGLFASESRYRPWYVAIFATLMAIWGSRVLYLITKRMRSNNEKKQQAQWY